MFVKVLKSKLHKATVTETRLDYAGSIGIDRDLMEQAGILPYEAVLIANLANGKRLQTYAIPAEAGSGNIEVLGAAAHLVKAGDRIIVFAFALCTPQEAANIKPRVLILDEKNKVMKG